MRISDWSSDVCSSDLLSSLRPHILSDRVEQAVREPRLALVEKGFGDIDIFADHRTHRPIAARDQFIGAGAQDRLHRAVEPVHAPAAREPRSGEHTSALQSLMCTSYAVVCLTNKHNN